MAERGAGRLAGKIAIVTGAGSGFGEGIARRFADEGASVIVNDINADAGQKVVADIAARSGLAAFVGGDVSIDAEVKALVTAAVEEFGRLDVVVNNAGTTHRNQPMLNVDEHEYDRIY